MANNVFFFYYVPTWDWPPEGPIKLGNVLSSIKKADQPLFTAPLPADSEVYSTEKFEVKYSREKAREGQFSILTKPLSVLGLGVDVGTELKKSHEEVFTFDRVETKQFIPTDDYVEKCINAEPVRRHLDRSRFRQHLYLITGIKTVHGAKSESFVSRTHGGMLGLAIDGTVISGGSVPAAIEPGTGIKVEEKRGTSWNGSSDFVFAFRVRKIRVSRKTKSLIDHGDYSKGAKLGDKSARIEENLPEAQLESQEESQAAEEGYGEEILMEGDTSVRFAVFEDEDSDSE